MPQNRKTQTNEVDMANTLITMPCGSDDNTHSRKTQSLLVLPVAGIISKISIFTIPIVMIC